ncbi:MAG: lactate racemase domain-containing protein [Gaiellaceae bacterium]
MNRVPLLAGPKVVVAPLGPGDVALHPRAPSAAIADVAEAVADALRFPLAGPPLGQLARPGSRATIVVEPPALPLPSAQHDPRQDAVAAAVAELERAGVELERQTIHVAGGLQRRTSPRDVGHLFGPEFRRRFRGRLVVHDVEQDDLVEVGDGLRVNPALVETDLVLVVSAAETVVHGGPALLLGAASAEALRAPATASLLESGSSAGWARAVELERTLQERTALLGVSLALNHPVPGGPLRGYPYEEAAVERLASSQMRRAFTLVPAPLRRSVLKSVAVDLTAFGVFAGPPSVAHAEALLRAIEVRAADLAEPLDALVVGIPPTTPSLPRERSNPVSVANLGLGLALRLWRNRPPLVEGGTVILLHHLRRHFDVPTQHPYRTFFRDLDARDAAAVAAAEVEAAGDARALESYRRGRTCHPLLPFAEWAACGPAIERAGSVLVAGCRDAVAARQLGFVPTHGLGPALEMAAGVAGGRARVGFLLAPPYFPLLVAET